MKQTVEEIIAARKKTWDEMSLDEKTEDFRARVKAMPPVTGKPIRCAQRSSLHQIINTQAKADRFMRQLRFLEFEAKEKREEEERREKEIKDELN